MSAAGDPGRGRPLLSDLRSHLTCVICAGFFIDATTIVECLHTFCRSCILRHLEVSSYCPVCDVMIHRTKGASSLRADRTLQTLVYKLVPGLFGAEMAARRRFYRSKPYADPELPGWAKGDVDAYAPHVYTADENVHVRLTLFADGRVRDGSDERSQGEASAGDDAPPARYLRCPASTPLPVLQKFVRAKFQLPPSVQVQLVRGRHVLPDDVTLMDLGYMHGLAQGAPVELAYRLVRRQRRPPPEPEPEPRPEPEPELAAVPAPEATSPAAPPPVAVAPPERMFDADDDEPTSPQIVEDLIASLDADAAAGGGGPSSDDPAGTEAGGRAGAALEASAPGGERGVNGASAEADIAMNRATAEESNVIPSACDGVVSEATRTSNAGAHHRGEANGEASGEASGEENKTRSRSSTVNSGKQNGSPSTGDMDSRNAAGEKATSDPRPAISDSVHMTQSEVDVALTNATTETESGVRCRGPVEPAESGRKGGAVVETSAVLTGPADPSLPSVDQGRGSRTNEEPRGALEKARGAVADPCQDMKASEVLIERRPNALASASVTTPTDVKRAPARPSATPKPTSVDCSVQTVAAAKVARPPAGNGRRVPCYAPMPAADAKSGATVGKSAPAVTVGPPVTGAARMNGAATPASGVGAVSSAGGHKPSQPVIVTTAVPASCKTTLNIPTKFSSALLKIPSTHPNSSAVGGAAGHREQTASHLKSVFSKDRKHDRNGFPMFVRKVDRDVKKALKRPLQEPTPFAKPAKVQRHSSMAMPLDLSSHARKTAVADSTSMLAKTPPPVPTPTPKPQKPRSPKGGGAQAIHSIVNSLASREHISLTPIPAKPSRRPSSQPSRSPTASCSPVSPQCPTPMPMPVPESSSCSLIPGGLFSPPLHVNTSMASRIGYDMAMRNLLTLSHMAMAQGGMLRPPMFPMQPVFPARPKSQDFHPIPDPSLLRQQSEARMGAASKKASPTAGSTAPQLRTPTALTSASIQHMEDLTRTLGKKRPDKERHSVTVTAIPFKG